MAFFHGNWPYLSPQMPQMEGAGGAIAYFLTKARTTDGADIGAAAGLLV